MKTIICAWLQSSLGIFKPFESLLVEMKDGLLFAKILHKYDVIDAKVIDLIVPTFDKNECHSNWNHLKFWFNLLGIDVNDETLNGILNDNQSVYIQLLYKLFLRLENKNYLHYITKQNERRLQRDTRFTIKRTYLPEIANSEGDNKCFRYGNKVLEHRNAISWYKEKRGNVKKKQSMMVSSSDVQSDCYLLDVGSQPKKSYQIPVPLVLEASVNKSGFPQSVIESRYIKLHEPDIDSWGLPDVVLSYVNDLSLHFKRSCKVKKMKKKYEEILVKNMEDFFLNKEEEDLKLIFSSKLLKQSVFEKQMLQKLHNIINQDSVQKDSYSKIKNQLSKLMAEEVAEDTDEKPVEDDTLFYHSEKKRTVELHRRLYAEKVKMRFEKHYALCLETIFDIIDLSIKKSEYSRLYNTAVPEKLWCEWKCLFHHGETIFDIFDDVEAILNCIMNTPPSERPDDIRAEMNRQSVLNKQDLNDYLNLEGTWDVIKVWPEGCNPDQTVLGYIVHTLLEFKYPLPPRPKPADIPKYNITAVLNGITDESVISKLQILLNKSGILLIDVNSAINYCIMRFRDVTCSNGNDVIHVIQQLGNTRGKSLNKDASPYAPKDISLALKDLTDKEVEKEGSIKDTNTKEAEAQTSNTVFYGISMSQVSNAVRLGKELFNAIVNGNEIPTQFIIEAIVEYIKRNKSIKGWVLINYPSTLYQASLLEYALTSKKFPYDLEEGTNVTFEDTFGTVMFENLIISPDEYRTSILVLNPRLCSEDDTFRTYFTIFITVIKGALGESQDDVKTASSTESILGSDSSTHLLEHPEREGIPTLHAFYQEQEIAYDFVYESFDLFTLKELARVILAEIAEEMPLSKPSTELFGDEALKQLFLADDRRYSIASIHKDSCVTKDNKNRLSFMGSSDTKLKKNTADATSEETVGVITKPGEKGWAYADFPILDSIKSALASVWEGIEHAFTNNLKEVFFLKRTTENSVIPYLKYIYEIMDLCVYKEDNRQEIVTEFIEKYNSIHPILRSDKEMTNELHCRVFDLETTLLGLCEKKRNETEEIRNLLIEQNWAFHVMVTITNAFISMLQSELNRSLATLELIQDYYLAMTQTYKSESIPTIILSKIGLQGGSADNISFQSKVADSLKENSSSNLIFNPVIDVIEKKTNLILATMDKLKVQCESIIAREESNKLKQHREYVDRIISEMKKEQEKKKKGKKTPKEETDESQSTGKLKDLEKEEQKLKSMFSEWNCVVKSELERLTFRTELIRRNAVKDIDELKELIGETFHTFYDILMKQYKEECDCVETLVVLLGTAIEEKTPLNANITFTRNMLFAKKILMEKSTCVLNLPPHLEEATDEVNFTINQLGYIRDKLAKAASSGIIGQQTFISIFLDLRLYGSKSGNMQLLPKLWYCLTSGDIVVLFHRVFGNASLIDWKHFLVYCLDLPVPVTEDIIDGWMQFLNYDTNDSEIVSYENYMKTTLWFHRELPETPVKALHNMLAKEFLFSIFKVDANSINYMALLLAFCKDPDPVVGFGKGLSLLMGRCVIVYEEDMYLEKIMTDHIDTNSKVVDAILDDILTCIVSTASGEDVTNIENAENLDVCSTISSLSDSDGQHISEQMYDQFFRRHKVLNWTSKVPIMMIISLAFYTYYPQTSSIFIPTEVYIFIDELRNNDLNSGLHDLVSVPHFLKYSCLTKFIERIHVFEAFSFPALIKEMKSDEIEISGSSANVN